MKTAEFNYCLLLYFAN